MDYVNTKYALCILLIFGGNSILADTDTGLFSGVLDQSTVEVDNGDNKTHTPVGFLPLPPDYNRLAIPLGNVSDAIFVKVYLSIREVLDVDTTNGIIEMDTEMGLTWFDWQIWEYFIDDPEAQKKASTGPESIILDSEFLKQIWKPDIYIDEMANVERTSILSKLITLKFIVRNPSIPGAISFRARQTLKLRCDMDFKYFPADIHDCTYNIRSYSYTEDQLFLIWDPLDGVYLDQLNDENFDFQISDVEPLETMENLFITTQVFDIHKDGRTIDAEFSQNYSALSFTLKIRRNLRYHLIQTYLPSVLLVLITWLCFLLPQDMVEVRIGISMTTLLTITAMFATVRQQSPDVSYVMAIDTWMIFCICSLFTALVLFTVLYWIRRRALKRTSSSDKSTTKVGVERTPVEYTTAQRKDIKRLLQRSKYAFLVFVIAFILFIALYAMWLIIASDYFYWEPSPVFNAVDEDKRLFQRQEAKFEPENEHKVVSAAVRQVKMIRERIIPRLNRARQRRLNNSELV